MIVTVAPRLPYPWLTARPFSADTDEVTAAECTRRLVIVDELRAGRLICPGYDQRDIETVARGLAAGDDGALLASGVGPIDWGLLANGDRDSYLAYAQAALNVFTGPLRPGRCPGYGWLEFTDDTDALVDLFAVPQREQDRRLIIAAELRAGNLRPGQSDDAQVQRVAQAFSDADDVVLAQHGILAPWEDLSDREQAHYLALAATAAALIAGGALWR
jgi:hypothetical protein